MLAGLIALAIVIVAFVGVLALYALHIRRTATELVNSASRIRSDQEAQRANDEWKRRLPGQYSAAPDGNGYRFELNNGWLATFRLVPSTGMQLQILTSPREIQLVTIGMYNSEASVWIQEAFSASDPKQFHISSEQSASGDISKAIVMFQKDENKATQALVFALNPGCLTKIGGCHAAEAMLPTIKQLLSFESGYHK